MTSVTVIEPSVTAYAEESDNHQITENGEIATFRGRKVTALKACCTWKCVEKVAFTAVVGFALSLIAYAVASVVNNGD